MGHYDFKEDLKVAQGIEEQIIEYLLDYNKDMVFHGFSNNKGYDAHFSIGDKYYKLEIKSDYFSDETGNIVIEFTSRGKASGIVTTQANLWAYVIITKTGLKLYILPTTTIKSWIDNREYERIFIGGDIGSNTKMYLFKMNKVLFETKYHLIEPKTPNKGEN